MSAARVVMGRAKRGLYAGRHIQFGNQVSEDGGNKSRRTWKPNVQEKRIFSLGLDRYIKIKITTHALRCIDKAGGLDEYLLTTPKHKLDNDFARDWRRRIGAVYLNLARTEIAALTVKPGMEDQLPGHLQARLKGMTLEQWNALEGRSPPLGSQKP